MKKKYQRLSKEAVTVLRSWLHSHQDYPYPTKEEKDALQQQTGLDRAQISDWFSNARRRTLVGGGASLAVEQLAPAADLSLQSPMERWKNSPPGSEAAATSDIMRALDTIERLDDDKESAGTPTSQYAWSSHSSSNSFVVGAPSTSTVGYSHSSSSDASFGHHAHYQPVRRPPTPMVGQRSLSRRRHRRRQKPSRPNDFLSHRQPIENRPYQCTFCTDSFRTKYDWERHEKALHLPVDLWTCAPDGGIVVLEGTRTCVFCQASNPETGHLLDRHDYFACQSRADGQRTFSRKDHLRQHLKLTHSAEYHSGIMDGWRTSRTIVSRCGLCDATFATWKERMDHVGAHFKNGADMAEWKGDWGFAPEVQRLVENAMPPYLLGHERRTMDPWKSSIALLGGSAPEQEDTLGLSHMLLGNGVPNAFNRYTDLRRALIDYIHRQTAAGICPTDEKLQQVARQFSYGGNDPLDQTFADYDPLWLEAVKHEAGLGTMQFGPQ
ncbi:uncharacterized protein BO95DRAFT_370815 [Aspergillus brunneoviolaceus CBS 621.78]|uniref:Uncharacterized protein n=1 Tax=Aspergillus brunneoviolaceus CBS 621.78 TaxID=1450534 RepID=A0ACD1FZM5_9EURO|nr:hypothetical protein BO95DRAFT_370815 [Aspergillus brunneoviolaceus CBS 621.78]RAH42407.1 hypothetical protein BO95DRAFT_370815 [Aspergillus brunneoviolaceus CBS 621.78]